MGDLAGRTALVTGGTSGIGAALSLGLAEAGAEVIAAGLRGANEPAHSRLTVASLDVTDPASVVSTWRTFTVAAGASDTVSAT